MPIVAASVIPHTPLLLPTIAKQHRNLFSRTTTAINDVANDWYAAKPDVAIIISPHGISEEQEAVLHSGERFIGRFEDYGDMSTTISAIGAVGISHQLKSSAEHEHVHIP